MDSRILTVSGLFVSPSSKSAVPAVRLQGKWLSRLGFNIGDKVIVYEGWQAAVITPAKKAAEKTAFNTPLEKELSDTRDELSRLIEVRESLSALILEISQRLDLLILEQIGNTDGKEH